MKQSKRLKHRLSIIYENIIEIYLCIEYFTQYTIMYSISAHACPSRVYYYSEVIFIKTHKFINEFAATVRCNMNIEAFKSPFNPRCIHLLTFLNFKLLVKFDLYHNISVLCLNPFSQEVKNEVL
jgi:hypothetical protein